MSSLPRKFASCFTSETFSFQMPFQSLFFCCSKQFYFVIISFFHLIKCGGLLKIGNLFEKCPPKNIKQKVLKSVQIMCPKNMCPKNVSQKNFKKKLYTKKSTKSVSQSVREKVVKSVLKKCPKNCQNRCPKRCPQKVSTK